MFTCVILIFCFFVQFQGIREKFQMGMWQRIVENKQLAVNHHAIKQLAILYGISEVFPLNRICKYFFCDLFIH